MTAMTHIETVTLGSSQSSITFSSIPQEYTDLKILLSLRIGTVSGSAALFYRLNNTTSGYSLRNLLGSGSSASSTTYTTETLINGLGVWGRLANVGVNSTSETSNTFSSVEVYLPNYAGASNKSVSVDSVIENNATLAYQEINAGLWSNTAAITQVAFAPYGNSFVQYSSASLYGITAGSSGGVTVS